jgi:DNA invertase Pin-like site-specific DNA recombinase
LGPLKCQELAQQKGHAAAVSIPVVPTLATVRAPSVPIAKASRCENLSYRNDPNRIYSNRSTLLQKSVAIHHSNATGFCNIKGSNAMKIGYARVSTQEQDTAGQVKKLKAAGCHRIFTEKESGGRWNRPQLQAMREHLRRGDTVVITKLDRLSRSLKDLLFLLDEFSQTGVAFECIDDHLETTSPAGKLMIQMIGAFAEFERSLIRQRTSEGLVRARAEGRIGGRPSKLTAEQKAHAFEQLKQGKSQAQVARVLKVDRATVCRLAANSPVNSFGS